VLINQETITRKQSYRRVALKKVRLMLNTVAVPNIVVVSQDDYFCSGGHSHSHTLEEVLSDSGGGLQSRGCRSANNKPGIFEKTLRRVGREIVYSDS
jgi:hypothetical protein